MSQAKTLAGQHRPWIKVTDGEEAELLGQVDRAEAYAERVVRCSTLRIVLGVINFDRIYAIRVTGEIGMVADINPDGRLTDHKFTRREPIVPRRSPRRSHADGAGVAKMHELRMRCDTRSQKDDTRPEGYDGCSHRMNVVFRVDVSLRRKSFCSITNQDCESDSSQEGDVGGFRLRVCAFCLRAYTDVNWLDECGRLNAPDSIRLFDNIRNLVAGIFGFRRGNGEDAEWIDI